MQKHLAIMRVLILEILKILLILLQTIKASRGTGPRTTVNSRFSLLGPDNPPRFILIRQN